MLRQAPLLLLPALLLASAPPLHAAPVPMTADHWESEGAVAFATYDGRQAVRVGNVENGNLHGGAVQLKDLDFTTGTIEYDVLADAGQRDFVSLSFRDAADDPTGELFYFRSHMNGNPDSTQYTPVVHGNLAWQIFTGPGFTSQVHFNLGHWIHIRADIYATSALISVDGQPALTIPHLKSTSHHGRIGFQSSAGARFANLDVTPIADYRDPHPAPPEPPLPPGSIAAWRVSPAITEADAMARATAGNWAGVAWQNVPAEANGIDNLTLAGADADPNHSYIARFALDSRGARTLPLDFGFSDSVHVYLNGQLLYFGHDEQGSRDYRFLGLVGFWDRLYLPLRNGRNEVTFVVTDATNGGTAAAARFTPDPAVRVVD